MARGRLLPPPKQASPGSQRWNSPVSPDRSRSFAKEPFALGDLPATNAVFAATRADASPAWTSDVANARSFKSQKPITMARQDFVRFDNADELGGKTFVPPSRFVLDGFRPTSPSRFGTDGD